jgi:hypothetical protein
MGGRTRSYSTGQIEPDPEQKAALVSFVRDAAKGLTAAHSATELPSPGTTPAKDGS